MTPGAPVGHELAGAGAFVSALAVTRPAPMGKLAARRRDAYAFFAHLLTEPTSAGLFADVLTSEAMTVALRTPDMESFLGSVRTTARRNSLAEIRQDARDLFAGPVPLVPPCESAYFEDRARSVEVAYAAAGFAPSTPAQLPPDHMVVEMWFVSRLCEAECEAAGTAEAADARAAAARFLNEHLACWLPRLEHAADRHGRTRFYGAVLRLTRVFVERDTRNHGSLPPSPGVSQT